MVYEKRLRILVWGGGQQLPFAALVLEMLAAKNDAEVCGITGNAPYYQTVLGWSFIAKEEIDWNRIDMVLVVAGEKSSREILQEIPDLPRFDKSVRVVTVSQLSVPGFTFHRQLEWNQRKVSIISNNCWGGVTYHSFQSQFYSPFINMFVGKDEEYLELCQHLPSYLQESLEFVRYGHNPVENFDYPIFRLHGIQFDMNHYRSIEEGEQAWEKRRCRMNWDDIFVMMYTQDETIPEAFERLPYARKVCFTSFPTEQPSSLYIPFVTAESMQGKEFWELVIGLARGRYLLYDPWELVLHGKVERLIT